MPADPNANPNAALQKIADIVMRFSTTGSDRAISDLGKIDKGLLGIERSTAKLKSSFTTLLSPIQQIAGIVGSGIGFSKGIQITEQYSKAIISLSSQLNKYGKSTTDAANQVETLSKTLGLTRIEAAGLASQFEKTFHTGNLEKSKNILQNIKNVVGSNAEAIKQMASDLGGMTMQYSDLQGSMDKLSEIDKKRLLAHTQMMVVMGKINLQQARSVMDYLNQNNQVSAKEKERLQQHKDFVSSMQELRTGFEGIALIIGDAIAPYLKEAAKWAKENKDIIEGIVRFMSDWGIKIGLLIVGAKSLYAVYSAISALRAMPSFFGASGAGAGGGIAGSGAVAAGGMGSIASKAGSAVMSVALVAVAAAAGSSLGEWIAKYLGGGVVGKAFGSTAGAMIGGAVAGAAVGGAPGAAIGAVAGSIFDLGSAIATLEKNKKDRLNQSLTINAEETAEARKSYARGDITANERDLKIQISKAKYEADLADSEGRLKDKKESLSNLGRNEEIRRENSSLNLKDTRDSMIARTRSYMLQTEQGVNPVTGRTESYESRRQKNKLVKSIDEQIQKETGGKYGTGAELAEKQGAGDKMEGVNEKALLLIKQRRELENGSKDAESYIVEILDVQNKKLEAGSQLRQMASGIIDVSIEKSLMLGNTESARDEVKEKSLKFQQNALDEIEERQKRIVNLQSFALSVDEQASEQKERLKVVNKEITETLNKQDSTTDKAEFVSLEEKMKKLVSERNDLQKASEGTQQRQRDIQSQILLQQGESVKRVIEIQNAQYKVYETTKKWHEVVKSVSDQYSQTPAALSERMQLSGSEDLKVLTISVDKAKEKLKIQEQANAEAQKQARIALEGGPVADKILKDAWVKSGLSEKDAEFKLKAMSSGQKQKEIEGSLVALEKEKIGYTKQRFDLDMQVINLYNTKKELAMSELGITEAYIGLMDQAGMGIGASVQMRMQAIGQTGVALEQVNKKIESIQNRIADNDDARQAKAIELKNAQQEQVQLLTKQWELSKALREGWASALTSQSIASGRVTKIMMTRQSNLATAIGQMGAAISSVTGTNQAGQGARKSSRFGVDAAGNATFSDQGNAFYGQDYRGMGGEVDMATMKQITDMQARGDRAGAASLYRRIMGGQQAARMSGNGRAYGAGVSGASAEYGPGSGSGTGGTPATGGGGSASTGGGTPVTLTFNVSTKAELDALMKKIEEHLKSAAGLA